MTYIDPHIHMLARTTADYEAMAAAGIVAVIDRFSLIRCGSVHHWPDALR